MGSSPDSWVGMSLSGGRYRVEEKLGEGGMGFVYRAHDRNLDCHVVIKVPRRAMLEEPEFAGRFAREIRSLVQLVHPNIVRVIDVGEDDGVPFSVMQYLSGGNLRERQGKDSAGNPARIQPRDLKTWLESVATALDFIHKQDYIHRDVKPENILFDQHGHAYLSDFGVAKALAADDEDGQSHRTQLTGTGMVLGTAAYMAPEVLLGQPFDGRADQYALGVTIYELLSGSVPYSAPTPAALIIEQTREPLRRLDAVVSSLPKGLADSVQRALQPDSKKRYADCRTLAKEVLAGAAKAPSLVNAPAATTPMAGSPAVPTPKIPCPHCGRTLNIRANIAGKRVRCPACNKPFTVPNSEKPAESSRKPAPVAVPATTLPGGATQEVKAVFQEAGVRVEAERIRSTAKIRAKPVFEYDDRHPRKNLTLIGVITTLAVATIVGGTWGIFALVHRGDVPPTTEAPLTPQPSPSFAVTNAASPSVVPPHKDVAKQDTGKETPEKRLASGPTTASTKESDSTAVSVRAPALPPNVSILGKHPDRVCAVAFDADGFRCLSASATEACVWNRGASQAISRVDLGGHHLVAAALSSQSGRLLGATGEVDSSGIDVVVRAIHLWDLYLGAKLKSIPLPDAEVSTIAISPDGRRALTGGKNGTTLWDLETGLPLHLYPSTSKIQSVSFFPKGNEVLSAALDTITTWDTVKWGRLQACRIPSTHLLAPTPDGRRFLAGGDTLVS